MDNRKKTAGWIVLGVVCVVAAAALAVTNLATEGPIAQRNLGAAQATLEGLFPEADGGAAGFESLLSGEDGVLQFAYAVRQNGQVIGYAVSTTVQGYAGPVEVIAGLEQNLRLRGVGVGGAGFKETEGLGAKAKEPAFTDQFQGKTPPLTLGRDVDGIAGATITSRAVVEGVNSGVNRLQALLGDQGGGNPGGASGSGTSSPAGRTANASAIGYGGPVLVRLTLDGEGKIAALKVGMARFLETEGLGSRVREEAFTAPFLGKTPPLTLNDVEAVSGATVSSQAAVDAVNEAAAFLNP